MNMLIVNIFAVAMPLAVLLLGGCFMAVILFWDYYHDRRTIATWWALVLIAAAVLFAGTLHSRRMSLHACERVELTEEREVAK